MMPDTLAPLAQALGLAVVHSLWQIALIWFIFKALSWFLARKSQAIYLLSLAAMLASAIWATATFAAEWSARSAAKTALFAQQNLPAPLENAANIGPTITSASLLDTTNAWLESHAALLGGTWMLCAALLWARLLGGWWLLRRLRTRGVSAPAEAFQQAAATWAKRLKIARKIVFLESLHISEPLTIGFWKPVVLFPAGMLLRLSPAQVEALLLHELAHIRRHDYLVNLFQLALEACFFYHPLFWLFSREARARREYACDDVVLRHTSDPILYAQTLTNLHISFVHNSNHFAMNATGKSNFTERILRIAGITPKRATRPNWLIIMLLPIFFGITSWWSGAEATPSEQAEAVFIEASSTADSLPQPKAKKTDGATRQPRATATPRASEGATAPPAAPSPTPSRRFDGVAMEAVRMNVFYIGVDNPLRVAVADVPTSELKVELLGAGRITGENGNYNVVVTQPGEVTVRAMRMKDGQPEFVIDQKYRVKRIPDPAPRMDWKYRSSTLTAEMMQQTKGLNAILENFDFDAYCEIVGFAATYLPAQGDPTARDNTGATWNSALLESIKQAKSGDAFFFDDIKVLCPGDTNPRNIGGLAFKIK